jgi:thiaminase/transcriptional activator TenA
MTHSSLSGRFRAANRATWDAMQAHRFVADIIEDRLDPEVFDRYLVFEHRFVETAILIFGQAMLKAPGLPQRQWLIGVLRALAQDQIGYFARTFAVLGIDAADTSQPVPAPVEAFRAGMLGVAESGGYLDVLAIMLAAEWMYASWCGRAAVERISQPELKHWVDLHADTEFRSGVTWLRAELDAAGRGLPNAECDRLAGLFGRALELEIGFHAAAYDAAWPVPRAARQEGAR